METTINTLRHFDVTESEAKAYITLAKNGACSGYEISKLSGVPRSKIYNILENLHNRGFVTSTQDDNAVLYKAEPIEQITRLIKNSTDDKLDLLTKQMQNFNVETKNHQIWSLNNYETVINKCLEMLDKAEHEILIQIWADDLTSRLEEAIMQKQESLGRVLIVLYDSQNMYQTKLTKYYKHGFEKNKIEDTGSRWITLTIDSNEMMHATILNEQVAEGVYTKNSGMVFFAHEYIKHDAYSLRLIEALGDRAKEIFGDEMEGIRDVFAIK